MLSEAQRSIRRWFGPPLSTWATRPLQPTPITPPAERRRYPKIPLALGCFRQLAQLGHPTKSTCLLRGPRGHPSTPFNPLELSRLAPAIPFDPIHGDWTAATPPLTTPLTPRSFRRTAMFAECWRTAISAAIT